MVVPYRKEAFINGSISLDSGRTGPGASPALRLQAGVAAHTWISLQLRGCLLLYLCFHWYVRALFPWYPGGRASLLLDLAHRCHRAVSRRAQLRGTRLAFSYRWLDLSVEQTPL